MESRWYLKRGQTLENTKIEDRSHALHVSKTAWDNIQKHLDRKKVIAGSLQEEHEYRKRIKEGSDNMTKHWENSVENIRKRAEDERQKRYAVKEDTKMKNYEVLRKQQDAIRQKYIDDKRTEAYMGTQYPKEINGALLLGEVIHQREKQLEFQKFMKEREAESEKASALVIKQAAEQELIENEAKQMAIRQSKEIYAMAAKNEILKKIKATEEEKRAEYQFYAVNNIRAAEEIAEYERIKHAAKIRAMKQAKAEVDESLANIEKRRIFNQKEDAEVDEVAKIFSDAKHRIYCFRKQRDKEIQNELIENRMKASANVYQAKKQLDADLDERIDKAMEEKAKAEADKEAVKQQKLLEQRAEREEDYKNALLEQERRQQSIDEEQKWELLNRFKKTEVMIEDDIQKRAHEAAKQVAYRKELDDQCKSAALLNASDDLDSVNVGKEQLKIIQVQDERFFKYAEEVLNLAKSKGRLTQPIEKVIAKYRREAYGEAKGKRLCQEEVLLRKTPGQRQHDPRSDPVYNRCKCQRDRLYR